MAQFTTQGRLKALFNGDGMFEARDPSSRVKLVSASNGNTSVTNRRPRFGNHKRKLRIYGSSTLPDSSSSSSSSFTNYNRLSAASSLSLGEDGIYDDLFDFEMDDLCCFRGLVLDISYRYLSASLFMLHLFRVTIGIAFFFRPINVVCWKRAICLEFSEKADVLEYYDQTVNSPGGSFYIPAVLRIPHLLQVVKRRRIKNTLSRRNILYRDNFTCQYCSSRENLTIDHVLPIARGGEWKWENLVRKYSDIRGKQNLSFFLENLSLQPLLHHDCYCTNVSFSSENLMLDHIHSPLQVTACASCNSQKGPKILEETNMKLMRTPKAPKDYDIVAIPLTNTAIKMLRMRKGTPAEWLQYMPNPSSEA